MTLTSSPHLRNLCEREKQPNSSIKRGIATGFHRPDDAGVFLRHASRHFLRTLLLHRLRRRRCGTLPSSSAFFRESRAFARRLRPHENGSASAAEAGAARAVMTGSHIEQASADGDIVMIHASILKP